MKDRDRHEDGPGRDDDDDGRDESAERRAAEGIDHLQAAATEMIAAARSFLDAVEGVVHDRDAVASVVDTLGTVAQAASQAAARVNPVRDRAGRPGGDEDPPPGVQHIRVQ